MDFNKTDNHTNKIKGLYRFFCWCSGARLYILKKCPTDYNVFFGIGMIVFLTGVMATMSGSYAFYTIFDNVWLSVIFGLFWGVLIFFFDWYLVASLKKENKFFKELLSASPRLILAIFLAVVISRPLELKLFESEIDAQIEKMNQQNYNDYKGLVNESFDEIVDLKEQNRKYQSSLDDLLAQRNELFDMFVEEAEGRSVTGTPGKGSVYREKKQQFDRVSKLYDDEKTRLMPLIASNNQRIVILNKKRNIQLESGSDVLKSSVGFLARIEAYAQLSKQDEGIKYTGLFILLMFICIETGPMFVKLISKRSAYDELWEQYEAELMSSSRQEISKIQEKTARVIELEKQKSIIRLEEELENNKNFTRQVLNAQAEIGAERIKRWKEREIANLNSDLSDYKPTIDELIDEAKLTIKPN